MDHGISQKSFQLIISELGKFSQVEEAIIYGSRAMGNYKNGSDIDLAIKGEEIDWRIQNRLKAILEEELPIPYSFDLTHYDSIKNAELKKHIDDEGLKIYHRK